ncbi:MAG: penicillin-binding protein 2 [Candidatus Nanopelagicales bacterium]
MSERSNLRLVVLGVLVVSLMATLLGRLFYLQVISGDTYRAAAANNSTREVVTPAVRGLVLDAQGRPMVANRISLVVSVDRTVVAREEDDGKAVLTRLAKALGTDYQAVYDRMQLCGTPGAKRPPICWNGSPYQPIPVAKDVDTETALQIMEQRADYPGVQAQLEAVREYPSPYGVNAAHLLGYLGPVTEQQLEDQGDTDKPGRLRRNDLVGRTGLEDQYDTQLRGVPGVKTLSVDQAGRVTGVAGEVVSKPGNYVVTNIDARLQSVVEQQLADAIERAKTNGYVGDSGAAVVVDVRNGHVLAMASYPTYDPGVWVGGISKKEYKQLVNAKALSSNAIQGTFAPGSTFKVISTSAAGVEGYPLYGTYDCPSSYQVGPQTFRNFESAGYGPISLSRALEVSCNTVFYGIADRMWADAGGLDAGPNAPDPIAETAKAYGLGSPTGIDLPDERRGRVGGRKFKQQNWEQLRDTWCRNAELGYPETRKTDPALADYYTALDKENCEDGYIWREGDALNAAIGQGDTAVTPLQMAMVYAAVANGGTLWQPEVARAIMSSTGDVVKEFKPKSRGKVKVPKSTIAFLQDALPGVTTDGSGRAPFEGFPLDQIPVASKTGSAQVTGDKPSTSWFASYAPANDPQYAIVMMVTQGGTGSGTSGPSVRGIYEALFGVKGDTVNPKRSVLYGGEPATTLPTINQDGTPVTPEGDIVPGPESAPPGAKLVSPSPSTDGPAAGAADPGATTDPGATGDGTGDGTAPAPGATEPGAVYDGASPAPPDQAALLAPGLLLLGAGGLRLTGRLTRRRRRSG